MAREKRKAVAYIRTSSAANVGPDKDSARRQRAAIAAFARRQGFELVDEFNDEAVSGADAIERMPTLTPFLSISSSDFAGDQLAIIGLATPGKFCTAGG